MISMMVWIATVAVSWVMVVVVVEIVKCIWMMMISAVVIVWMWERLIDQLIRQWISSVNGE